MTNPLTRRSALKVAGATLLGAAMAPQARADEKKDPYTVKGNINHSFCRWCYGKIELVELATKAKAMGYKSIELLTPDEFLKVKPLGMTCAVLSAIGGISDCYNRAENHEKLNKKAKELIDFAAEHGLPNVITFSGNRKGLADEEGLKVCAEGLKQIVGYAEEKKVTIIMELLNSKVNHADYQCDKSAWGVELCKKVGSERFKLLYDIYHMQIMEGDVIRTIKANHQYYAHYHTGGNPGRNEIDETQELYYPAIMKAILETGYKGYVSQEFIPKREPLASLEQGLRICDV
jgi:hydroxypyruvate isomerase